VRAVIVVMSAISSAREIILFLSVLLLPFIAAKKLMRNRYRTPNRQPAEFTSQPRFY